MTHRFYCPSLRDSGSVTLTDTEAHHLSHVLRHQPDDLVELFDGAGLVATCRIISIGKRDVELVIVSPRRVLKPPTELIVATAVPKGDRFDWLVEKATELGVSRLVPLTTQRSIVDPRSSKLDKLRQTVVTACKQSGRNHLMAIHEVTPWSDFLEQLASGHQLLIAHPQGETLSNVLATFDKTAQPIAVAIGPEGGLTDDEVQLAGNHGAKAVHLGELLLRIETAAIAISARILL